MGFWGLVVQGLGLLAGINGTRWFAALIVLYSTIRMLSVPHTSITHMYICMYIYTYVYMSFFTR